MAETRFLRGHHMMPAAEIHLLCVLGLDIFEKAIHANQPHAPG